MATAQLYVTHDNSTQPNFQAWAKALSDQLTAMGWTKTSDTGQVDWTTNPAVPGVNVWTLYEIRQPASDPLQTGATAYYLRIDYGTTATNVPGIRVTLGTATNGAGTLVGLVTSPMSVGAGANGTATGATPWECDFSWDINRLGVLMWRNSSSVYNVGFFGVERTKNTSGGDNSDGVTLVINTGQSTSGTASPSQQTIVFGIGVAPQLLWMVLANSAATSLAFANSVPLSPVFPCYGKWANPMTICGGLQGNDAVEGAFLTTTLYGSTRTYLMVKTMCMRNEGSATAAIIRFD